MALLLFSVFALCVLMVLLTGADAYQRLTERGQASYTNRTAAQYIVTKLRQADRLDGISVCDFEGQDALVVREKIGGDIYETRIYYYDGYLWELFAQAEGDYHPEDGEKLFEAGELLLDREGAELYIRLQTAEGDWEELAFFCRSGEEVCP